MSDDVYQVYHETQQAGLCAVHALNALLQGPLFTAVDLAAVARALDEQERRMMAAGGVDGAAYLKFMAEDSGNVAEDGNFSVQVLAKALETFGLALLRTSLPDGRARLSACARQTAFIANLGEHWLCQRRVGGAWWDLNSLHAAPRHLSPLYLETYLHSLVAQGYDLFVVVGDLPAPSATLDGAGAWFTAVAGAAGAAPQLLDADGEPVVMATPTAASAASAATGAPAAAASADDGDDMQRAIAASMAGVARSSAPRGEDAELAAAIAASMADQQPPATNKPDAAPQANKRPRHDAAAAAAAADDASEPTPAPADDNADAAAAHDEEAALRAAIALSLQM